MKNVAKLIGDWFDSDGLRTLILIRMRPDINPTGIFEEACPLPIWTPPAPEERQDSLLGDTARAHGENKRLLGNLKSASNFEPCLKRAETASSEN